MPIDFNEFQKRCKSKWRHIPDEESGALLDLLTRTIDTRREVMPSGTELHRAQLGCEFVEVPIPEIDDFALDPTPYDRARMKPQVDRALEGRANPRGVPMLYLASDMETAVAEVRPYVDAHVTAALFKTNRDLVVVDCTRHFKPGSVFLNWDGDYELQIWADIEGAFGRPVQQNESTPEYAATQLIAEHFRHQGADGIVFRSSLGGGNCIVLFSPDVADPMCAHVLRIRGVKYDVIDCSGTYQYSQAEL